MHTSTTTTRTLEINITAGSSEVEIVGTKAVPEFSLVMVMIILTISVVILMTKFSSTNLLKIIHT